MRIKLHMLFLFLPPALFADQPKIQIPLAARAPQLSDYTGEADATPGLKITGFTQRLPKDGAPARAETTVYLSYDRENLYAVFQCSEEPGQVRAQLAKREDIGNDDVVSLYLDTFHDNARAYVFSSNPLGIQRDGLLLEGQKPDYNFDTIWHAQGRRTGSGFVVLFTIPFKSLRFRPGPGQEWGIALGRYSVVRSEDSYWPRITSRVASFTPQFATAEMAGSLSASHNIQLQPYLTFFRARTLNGMGYDNSREVNGGLDAKAVLADALTFDLTVRPDFSQVESDEPQVTVNQRYEVLFPEKRPFFLENSTYFDTPIPLFFSRRIVSPDYGAKLTGKIGSWALGALASDDTAAAGNVVSGGKAEAGVLSLHRDFGNQSRFGFMATTRDLAGNLNSVFSADLRLRLSSNLFFSGQVFRTETETPGTARSGGNGYYAALERTGYHFTSVTKYTDLAPTVQDQLGYIRRVDIRTGEQYAEYRWRPNRKWLLSFGPNADILVNYDHKGKLQDAYGEAGISVELPRQTELKLGHSEAYEYYQLGFRHSHTDFSAYTAWKKWLFVYGSYGYGTNINYSPPSGVNPFLGNDVSASASLAIRPTNRLRFDETYLHSRLRVGDESVFNNHLIRSKLNFQFTKQTSLRFIAEYNAVLPNTSLFDARLFKRLTGDILFTYLLQPGTAIYVGYTDRYDNLALTGPDSAPVVLSRKPTLSTGRQVFVKLSYNLRF